MSDWQKRLWQRMFDMDVPEKYRKWVLAAANESMLEDTVKLLEWLENSDVYETDDQLLWEHAQSICCMILYAVCYQENEERFNATT